MKITKLKIVVVSLVMLSLLGTVAPSTSNAALTEEAKFQLKRDIIAAFYDLAVIYYGKIETAVEKSTWLTKDEQVDLLAVIEPGKATFEDQRDKMRAAATEDELTALTEEAKEKWGSVQTDLRQVEGDIYYDRINKVIAKATIISGSAKAVSTTFQTLGTDTTNLDKLIADFDLKVEEGTTAAKAGVDVYKTIIRLGDLIKVPEALEHFEKAWLALLDAKALAEKAVSEMETMVSSQ